MSLPPDFWEEFDRRLDAKLEAKLEAKFDAKLKPIYSRLQQLTDWTARQDLVLEKESTIAIFNHLKQKVRSAYVVRPSKGFPMRITSRDSGREITEMDGVVVLTTNPEYESLLKAKIASRDATPLVLAGNFTYRLIIIEAKQHLTKHKYDTKVAQKKRIEAMIRDANFTDALLRYGFQSFDPEVGLYFGANIIDEAALELLHKDALEAPWMGWLDLTGMRYMVCDKDNAFGEAVNGITGYGGRGRHVVARPRGP